MIVLKLKVGDRVRNINKMSKRRGCQGVVHDVSYHGTPELDASAREYHVVYDNGMMQSYDAHRAHIYLELIAGSQTPTKLDYGTAYRDASMMPEESRNTLLLAICDISGLQQPGKRKVLSRERVNVITGKTQSQMVKELGPARGVQQFNTRALGTTTGQAFRVIGDAMCNPGTEIRISKVDHAKENELCSTSWTTLDKNFRAVVQTLIGDRKGFTFTPTHIVFNPIVTEEVYVE